MERSVTLIVSYRLISLLFNVYHNATVFLGWYNLNLSLLIHILYRRNATNLSVVYNIYILIYFWEAVVSRAVCGCVYFVKWMGSLRSAMLMSLHTAMVCSVRTLFVQTSDQTSGCHI